MAGFFFWGLALDGAIEPVKCGGRSMVALPLGLWPASRRRLPIAGGAFFRDLNHFRDMDGFYHTMRIDKFAAEL